MQWEKGITYRNSKVPYFIPAPPFFLLIPSDLEHLPFLSFCFKTQVFLHQKKRPLKLVPALMSIFIIVNIFRAEMGVVHTCAILEPELIMLFYKMIIVGLFGSFFFSDEANSWASITFLQALETDHSHQLRHHSGSLVLC